MNDSEAEKKLEMAFYYEVTNGFFFNRPPIALTVFIVLVKRIMESKTGETFTTLHELKDDLSYYIGYRKTGPSVHMIRHAIYTLWEAGKLHFSSTKAGYFVKFRKGEPLDMAHIERMKAHAA